MNYSALLAGAHIGSPLRVMCVVAAIYRMPTTRFAVALAACAVLCSSWSVLSPERTSLLLQGMILGVLAATSERLRAAMKRRLEAEDIPIVDRTAAIMGLILSGMVCVVTIFTVEFSLSSIATSVAIGASMPAMLSDPRLTLTHRLAAHGSAAGLSFVILPFDADCLLVIAALALTACVPNTVSTIDAPSPVFESTNWLSDPKSQKLSVFLAINLCFMVVELVVGISSNSLGLISDAFHMMLDSASVAIGLYAACIAKAPPSSKYPFGRARFEVLSGFTNGVLLVFLGIGIFIEGCVRLYNPAEVHTQSSIPVSVGGLLVNLVGVIFFHEAHSHSHSHSHGGGHCHSHGHSHCGGSDPEAGDLLADDDGDSYDANMRGVYLHILADLLGSIGVIISGVIVHMTGFSRADSICSICVSTLVLFAARALLQDTAHILVISCPAKLVEHGIEDRIRQLDGIVELDYVESWSVSPGDSELGTGCNISVKIIAGTEDRTKAALTTLLCSAGAASSVDVLTIETRVS
jgi:zinc transporter 5/7